MISDGARAPKFVGAPSDPHEAPCSAVSLGTYEQCSATGHVCEGYSIVLCLRSLGTLPARSAISPNMSGEEFRLTASGCSLVATGVGLPVVACQQVCQLLRAIATSSCSRWRPRQLLAFSISGVWGMVGPGAVQALERLTADAIWQFMAQRPVVGSFINAC